MDETLIDSSASDVFKNPEFTKIFQVKTDFINAFNEKSFRVELKKVIFNGELSSNQLLNSYAFEKSAKNELKFAKTLELLVAYLCVKELKAYSASFGVNIKGSPSGGDFDCIANFYNDPIYFEIKSGQVQNTHENVLHNFIDRHLFLAPYASVLFFDYSGGKDKLDQIILKLKNKNLGVNKIDTIYKVVDGSRKFYSLINNIIIVDIHESGDMLINLRSAMQYLHRCRAYQVNMMFSPINPNALGYKVTIM
ncbi:hypothetical protein [Niastella populi]|uniref:Uncharacterized protein n=1 Tax=Niastella populi TaxID=550983 RepID=A0A1V9EP57_9BACT|nr:hypothetical protein [Niastella populi]OQP47943.1 hypothetical protein A4R26_31575 [Niastella populi]